MGWKAVASLSEQDLKDKLAMPKKKEEKQDDRDKGKKDDNKKDGKGKGKEEDKDKGQGGDGRGQGDDGQGRDDGSSGGGSGPQDHPQDPPELPDEEPELDPDEEQVEEEPETLIDKFRNWREERKKMKEERAKREIATYGKKLGVLDRLSLKLPWLGKILKRDVKELSLEEQLEEAGIPRVHTEEELKRAEAIRSKNREALGNYGKNDEQKEEAENMARKALEERIAAERGWIEQGIQVFEKEEVEKAYGALWIAQGYFKDVQDIEEMWNRERVADGKQKQKLNLQYLPITDKLEMEEIRNVIKKQLPTLSVEEISARQEAWLGLKIFEPNEIKVFSTEAKDRAQEAKARRARIEARNKGDRSAHRAFADRINGGRDVSAPVVGENGGASGEPQRTSDVAPTVGAGGEHRER